MIITSAKQTQDSNWVTLTFDDGSTGQVSIGDNIRRQHTDLYNEFIEAGGVLEPEFSAQEITDKAEATRQQDIKDSCRSQIYTMYDAEDQMNMTAEAATTADAPRKAELTSVFAWVKSMVGLSRTCVADGVTLESNIVWPVHTKIVI